MALFVQKLGTNVCVLAPREGLLAALSGSLGSDWTEARIGMYFSGVDHSNVDTYGPVAGEDVPVASVADYLTLGLKDEEISTLPGESGSLFLGVRSTGAVTSATRQLFADEDALCSAFGYHGSTGVNGGLLASSAMLYPDPELATGYSGFYCVKLKVNNRGGATQSVDVSVSRSAQVEGTDYGKAALTQAINNAEFSPAVSVPWNTGVAARALPSAAWIRIPFYNFRIRVQALMAIKITP